jgi:hypothetical protein
MKGKCNKKVRRKYDKYAEKNDKHTMWIYYEKYARIYSKIGKNM